MGVTPVRALNSIKRDVMFGVANNPVFSCSLFHGLGDSSFGKPLTSLAKDFLISALHGNLHDHCLLPVCPLEPRLYRR